MTASEPGLSWALAGLILGPAVAAVALWAGALSVSGAAAAAGVGAVVLAAGGLPWAVLLLAFFVSGSALTGWRLKRGGRSRVRRDAAQVLANGGVAAAAGVLRLALGPAPGEAGLWDLLMAGSLAAMTADTWASEIGVMSGSRPRLLVGGTSVPPGTSGAVSWPGTAAGLAGALLMAVLAGGTLGGTRVGGAVLAGGMVGLFLDSLLGATIQARFQCRRCGRAVESARRHRHDCPGPVERCGGMAWLDNDGVNALAAAGGGLAAAALLL